MSGEHLPWQEFCTETHQIEIRQAKKTNLEELGDVAERLGQLFRDHRHGVAVVDGQSVDEGGMRSADNDWGFRTSRL